MPQHLAVEQRTFLVKRYLETKNVNQTLAEFSRRFPNRPAPKRSTVHKNVKKFSENGSVENLHKGRSGRRKSARTIRNIQLVQNAVLHNEKITCRRNPLLISKTSFNRIMRLDLKYHPYKVHKRHQLQNRDYGRRLRFSRWFVYCCRNPRFLANIVVGDEAAFAMNGEVSSQNVRCYAPLNHPPATANFDVSTDRRKLHLWGGICGNGTLLGPFFFQQNVNGQRYLDMLNNQALPQLALNFNININRNRLWWVQDGATAHRTVPVRRRLQQVFGHRVIALGHGIEWPPRSPDLTPCDFFLWGYLKQKVYTTPPTSIAQLRQRIIREMDALRQNPRMLRNAIRAMERRAAKCIQNNGGHVEGN